MQKQSAAAAGIEPVPFRCPHCNRLLFKGCVRYVEIKCPKCGCIHTIRGRVIFSVSPLPEAAGESK
ncbi:MAG: Com family DNA-binding transcriptional regulator [Sporomusaceae bacterium]|nr:Com family DNA-binding transcriptional regulator [Sporomusaceae bacterium]